LGDREAFERLLPLAYSELRATAERHLRHERPGHTLQATALVHELYLRLVNQRKAEWADRAEFYRFAAKLMRLILIDHARTKGRAKRGGGSVNVPLCEDLPWIDAAGPELLDLETALQDLTALDERKARLIELRAFLGCSLPEAAETMGISLATAGRDLAFAKAWLSRRLRGEPL
jgi:RNA polymerase sigma factor (TIGR02999 family)